MRTLGSGQTSVSFLSLLSGGSDQTDQTWVTLQDENKCKHTEKKQRLQQCPFVQSNFKASAYEPDKS